MSDDETTIFEQTNDLVRFRVRCTRAAHAELLRLKDSLLREGQEYYWLGTSDGGLVVDHAFLVLGADAYRVLDVLAKHGVDRVASFPG